MSYTRIQQLAKEYNASVEDWETAFAVNACEQALQEAEEDLKVCEAEFSATLLDF